VFDEIRAAGYIYDSSIFPASRGHGGMTRCQLEPHVVQTTAGELVEIPQSMVEILGRRMSFFGGGYLRLAPMQLIRWGIRELARAQRPLIVYVHPREVDPDHPRLPLPPWRRFKCYVNLHTTFQKVKWLCETYRFSTMRDLMNAYVHGSSEGIEVVSGPHKLDPGALLGQRTLGETGLA
jgi:hypothetical protein